MLFCLSDKRAAVADLYFGKHPLEACQSQACQGETSGQGATDGDGVTVLFEIAAQIDGCHELGKVGQGDQNPFGSQLLKSGQKDRIPELEKRTVAVLEDFSHRQGIVHAAGEGEVH